jgi:hypothetical protein
MTDDGRIKVRVTLTRPSSVTQTDFAYAITRIFTTFSKTCSHSSVFQNRVIDYTNFPNKITADYVNVDINLVKNIYSPDENVLDRTLFPSIVAMKEYIRLMQFYNVIVEEVLENE